MQRRKYTTDIVCGKCGAPLIFKNTSREGTTVKLTLKEAVIDRESKMPFLWVTFVCSEGCDWRLVTADISKDVKRESIFSYIKRRLRI